VSPGITRKTMKTKIEIPNSVVKTVAIRFKNLIQ